MTRSGTTGQFENLVIEQYQQIGDLDKTAQRIAAERLERDKVSFGDMEFWIPVSKIEVRCVLHYAKLLDETPAT